MCNCYFLILAVHFSTFYAILQLSQCSSGKLYMSIIYLSLSTITYRDFIDIVGNLGQKHRETFRKTQLLLLSKKLNKIKCMIRTKAGRSNRSLYGMKTTISSF